MLEEAGSRDDDSDSDVKLVSDRQHGHHDKPETQPRDVIDCRASASTHAGTQIDLSVCLSSILQILIAEYKGPLGQSAWTSPALGGLLTARLVVAVGTNSAGPPVVDLVDLAGATRAVNGPLHGPRGSATHGP